MANPPLAAMDQGIISPRHYCQLRCRLNWNAGGIRMRGFLGVSLVFDSFECAAYRDCYPSG
jgi:hypothetical protein